jgi:hypothetical protein
MWHTGIDPFTKKEVQAAKGLRDRRMQRALMQFFKPENYFEVRQALAEAGRGDLIGGCDGLIPTQPPKEAIEARRKQANHDHYHTVANPARGEKPGERGFGPPTPTGYRPSRKTCQRQQGETEERVWPESITLSGAAFTRPAHRVPNGVTRTNRGRGP